MSPDQRAEFLARREFLRQRAWTALQDALKIGRSSGGREGVMSEHAVPDPFDNVGLAVSQLVCHLEKFVEQWPEEDRCGDALSGTLHYLTERIENGAPLRVPPEGELRQYAETQRAKRAADVEDDDDA